MPLPEHPQAKQNKANRRSEETDNVFLMTGTTCAINKACVRACVTPYRRALKEPEISNPQREKKKVGGRNAPDAADGIKKPGRSNRISAENCEAQWPRGNRPHAHHSSVVKETTHLCLTTRGDWLGFGFGARRQWSARGREDGGALNRANNSMSACSDGTPTTTISVYLSQHQP